MQCFYQLVLWFLCTAAGCQEAVSPAPEPQVPQAVTDAVRWIEEAGNKRDQATTKAREALRKAIEAALSGVRRRQGGSALEKAKDAGELEQDLAALDGAFVMPQSRLVRAAAAAFEKAEVQARRDYRATVIRVAAGIASQHVEDSERLLRELDAEFPAVVAPATFARQLAELDSKMQATNRGNRNQRNAPIMDIRDDLNRLVRIAGEHRITAAELRIEMVKLIEQIGRAPQAFKPEVRALLPQVRATLEELLHAAKSGRS